MTEQTGKINNTQQGPFELDLAGEMEQEFKRSVQISMPRGGGTKQFNIDCWFKYGTSDDITRAGDERVLMMNKLKRWAPALKILMENENGVEVPRTLSSDGAEKYEGAEVTPENSKALEELEENKRLLLSIPWLRQPIAQAWFNAILGNSQSDGKTKN